MEKALKSQGKIFLSTKKTNEIKKLISLVPNVNNVSLETKDDSSVIQKLNAVHMSKTIKRNVVLDSEYKVKFENNFKKFPKTKKSNLYIFEKREELLQLIDEHQIVLIHGETGSGKTTQIPQFILNEYIQKGKGSVCNIASAQPTRQNAINAANKIAIQRNEEIDPFSSSVGYQVKFGSKLPRKSGAITFYTSGFLLKIMGKNPLLNMISHLIIDEIQERKISTDFLLAITKQLITKRKDLKIILISTSVINKKISKYFDKCIRLKVSKSLHSVQEYYLEDVLKLINYETMVHSGHDTIMKKQKKNKISSTHKGEPLKECTSNTLNFLQNPESEILNFELIFILLMHIYASTIDEDILIFLPTYKDILKLTKKIEDSKKFPVSKYNIIQFYTINNYDEHDFNSRKKRQKNIYICSIPESVLAIDKVRYVIDCGQRKIGSYDTEKNIQNLSTVWISLESAEQRKRIAGRTSPGICYHLFTTVRRQMMTKYSTPEILLTKLDNIILQIKELSLGAAELFLKSCIDTPDVENIHKTIEYLIKSNILNENENFTVLGKQIVKLSWNTMIGKMVILGSIFSCLDPILTISAYFEYTDLFLSVPREQIGDIIKLRNELFKDEDCDFLLILEIFNKYENITKTMEKEKFCEDYFFKFDSLSKFNDLKQMCANKLFNSKFISSTDYKLEIFNKNSTNLKLVQAIVASSLYPNIAIIKNYRSDLLKNISIITMNQEKVKISELSVNAMKSSFKSPLLIYRSILKTNNIYLNQTSTVTPLQLIFFLSDVTSHKEKDKFIISLSNKINFFSCKIIMDLRKCFTNIFKSFISEPCFVNWEQNTAEISVLRCIVNLISMSNDDLESAE